MDIRNGNITVGEILKNEKVRAEVNKYYPQLWRHPLLKLAVNLPLSRAILYIGDAVTPSEKKRLIEFIKNA